jgi:hypothetical protein
MDALVHQIETHLLAAGGWVPTGQICEVFQITERSHRLRRHAIAELRRVRRWDQARKHCLTGKRPYQTERHTGQLVFL